MGATVTPLHGRRGRQSWMLLRSRGALLAAMVEVGATNESLAQRAKCSAAFISQLRTGKRNSCTPLLAQRIARALNQPVSALFMARVSSVQRAA